MEFRRHDEEQETREDFSIKKLFQRKLKPTSKKERHIQREMKRFRRWESKELSRSIQDLSGNGVYPGLYQDIRNNIHSCIVLVSFFILCAVLFYMEPLVFGLIVPFLAILSLLSPNNIQPQNKRKIKRKKLKYNHELRTAAQYPNLFFSKL